MRSCNLIAVTAFILAMGASIADAALPFDIEMLSLDAVYQTDNGFRMIDWANKTPNDSISFNGSIGSDPQTAFNIPSQNDTTSLQDLVPDGFRPDNAGSNDAGSNGFESDGPLSTLSYADFTTSESAHLGWGSFDPAEGGKGRHAEYGRRVTDLVGVFSIQMNIKLGSNLSCRPGEVEWMPCL